MRPWLILAGLNGAMGVAMSAVAAHAFGADATAAAWSETASGTQTVHALALVGVALLAERPSARLVGLAGLLFTIGIALFAGSLYARAFGLISTSPLAPLGGSLLIIGWLALAFHGIARRGGEKA